MQLIIATILIGIVLMYYLLRGKKGLREMRETIVDLTNTTRNNVPIATRENPVLTEP
jgi:hypothetical protein